MFAGFPNQSPLLTDSADFDTYPKEMSILRIYAGEMCITVKGLNPGVIS